MPCPLGLSQVGTWGDVQKPFSETMGAGEPLFSPSAVAHPVCGAQGALTLPPPFSGSNVMAAAWAGHLLALLFFFG